MPSVFDELKKSVAGTPTKLNDERYEIEVIISAKSKSADGVDVSARYADANASYGALVAVEAAYIEFLDRLNQLGLAVLAGRQKE